MDARLVLAAELVADPSHGRTSALPADSPAQHRVRLWEAQLWAAESRVLQARRRAFGGRSFLLWAEDAHERGGVLLRACDEATGARGSLVVRDADLRKVFPHFAEVRLGGVIVELGLRPEGTLPAGLGVYWPSATAEALVGELLARLLDAVYFEVSPLGDEWSMRLPGVGPQPRAEVLGEGGGPALQLAIGVGGRPGPAPVPGQGGAGPLPPALAVPWAPVEAPAGGALPLLLSRPDPQEQPWRSASGPESPALGGQRPSPSQRERLTGGDLGESDEFAPAAGCGEGDPGGLCGPPLAVRLSALLPREGQLGQTASKGAGWARLFGARPEVHADSPGLRSPLPEKPPWRPAAKRGQCFDDLHPLAERTLFPQPAASRSGLFHGDPHCSHRPRSATVAWSRREGACTSTLHAVAGSDSSAEVSPGKAEGAPGVHNFHMPQPRLQSSRAPCWRLHARHIGVTSVPPDVKSLNALV